MRDDLVGYLFDALDAAEVERVESALADPQSGPALRRELEQLRLATKPLARDRSAMEVPPGLAQRTIQSITQSSALPMPRVFTPEGVGPPRIGSKNRMDRLMLAAMQKHTVFFLHHRMQAHSRVPDSTPQRSFPSSDCWLTMARCCVLALRLQTVETFASRPSRNLRQQLAQNIFLN